MSFQIGYSGLVCVTFRLGFMVGSDVHFSSRNPPPPKKENCNQSWVRIFALFGLGHFHSCEPFFQSRSSRTYPFRVTQVAISYGGRFGRFNQFTYATCFCAGLSEMTVSTFVQITILVAAEGVHKLPAINNSQDLKEALQKLAAIPSSKIMVTSNSSQNPVNFF